MIPSLLALAACLADPGVGADAAVGATPDARGTAARSGEVAPVEVAPSPPATAPTWPAAGAPLRAPAVRIPEGFGVRRVYLDAGHGAADNSGNRSVLCRDEQDVTLEIARAVAPRLEATGAFEVRVSRGPGALVPYPARVAEAEAWRAEAFVSLHSDTRDLGQEVARDAGGPCYRNDGQPGFSVLWSDEHPTRTPARRRLAEAVGARMAEAGFGAYRGDVYPGLYEEGRPGVFVDRHAPGQRILVLRRPTVPSVIVETHHAWHPEEAARWAEPATWDAFAGALAAALVDAVGPSGAVVAGE